MSVRSKKRKRELDTIDNGGLEEIDNVHNNKNKVKPSKESGFNEHIITPLKKLKDAFTNYISPSKNEKEVFSSPESKKKDTSLITSTPRRKNNTSVPKSSDSSQSKSDSEISVQINEENKSSENNVLITIFSPLLKVGKTLQSLTQKDDIESDSSDDIIGEIENILSENHESSSESIDHEDEYIEEEFDSYAFIASLPEKLPSPLFKNILPKMKGEVNKKTLVLDLDETLVHSSLEKIDNPDLVFKVPFFDEEFEVYVRKRPHFEYFLKTLSKKFEIAIFTASQQAYADKLLNILDPKKELIHHRIFRDNCTLVLGNYLKDLSILGRDLSKVIIVDNSPHVFAYQIDNGIPIESWFDDDNDEELLKLIPFLESLIDAEDVRPLIREKYCLFKIIEERKKNSDLSKYQLIDDQNNEVINKR